MNCKTGLGGVDSVDFGMAALRYDHGVSLVKENATEVGGAPMRRHLVFAGTKGTLEINPIERPCGNGLDLTEIREVYEGDPSVYRRTFPPYGRYTAMLESFASMVRGEKTNPYDYEYERGLHKLILKTCGV